MFTHRSLAVRRVQRDSLSLAMEGRQIRFGGTPFEERLGDLGRTIRVVAKIAGRRWEEEFIVPAEFGATKVDIRNLSSENDVMSVKADVIALDDREFEVTITDIMVDDTNG